MNGSVYFFVTDIIAERGADLRLEQSGKIGDADGECSGCVLNENALVQMLADVIHGEQNRLGIGAVVTNALHASGEIQNHLLMNGVYL